MTHIQEDLTKPMIPAASAALGLMLTSIGYYGDLFWGMQALNAYTALGVLFLVHFLSDLESGQRAFVGWGLWFAGLASQLVYTLTTENMEMVAPLGLVVANHLFSKQEKNDAFDSMLLMVLLVVLPFQYGALIGTSAMMMAGKREEGMSYYISFAVAASLAAAANATGGASWMYLAILLFSWLIGDKMQPDRRLMSWWTLVICTTIPYWVFVFVQLLIFM